MTVQDGVQYAYSSVRIRDQVSFFILPNSGVPVERRYNNYKYVYKQHALPLNEVATALTPVLSMSSVLATTTKGNLYLRHAKDPGGEQVWTNVTWRRHKIIGGGQFFNLGPSENKQPEKPFEWDQVHAMVTFNSSITIKALHNGVPCFSNFENPCGEICESDFTKIETPMYADREPVFHSLAYGQFTQEEFRNGWALSILDGR